MNIDLDDWNMLPTQSKVYNDNFTNVIMKSAGLGAGKSHGAVRKALQLSALNKGFSGGFLCPSYADYKRDIKPLFDEILEEMGLKKNIHWWYHGTDKTYSFIWNRSPLYIFTAEKPIAGPNLAYCLINEFSLCQYERIKEMLRRVRVKNAPFKQKVLVGTPEDVYGWVEDFVEQQEKLNETIPNNFILHVADTDENVHIDENYGAYLTGSLDEQQLKVFKSGIIGQVGSNLFYYKFHIEKNRTDKVLNYDLPIYVNIDFNVGNMHATVSQIEYRNGKKYSYFVDEIVLKQDGADTYAMRKAVQEKYYEYTESIIVTIDASGRNRKTTGAPDAKVLKEVFPNVRYKSSGNDRLKKRQIVINGLLYHQQILVNKDKCPVLWKDMRKVKQKADFTKDGTNKDLTHACDTLDYFIMEEYNLEDKDTFNTYKAI